MKRKVGIDKMADDLLKVKDKADSLLRFSGRASGLTAFMVNKSKEEILKNEADKKIPILKEKLKEKKDFFDRKTIKSDNIRNLNNEINKCDQYIDSLKGQTSIEDLKFILDWYYKIWEKYGF